MNKDENKNTELAEEKKNEENSEVISEPENKKANKKISIMGIIGKVIVAVVIIFAITILIRVTVYKKYDVFGCRFYLIMSGSMEPAIGTGDAVITKEISNPQVGDIIAFDMGGATTVHRIVKTYTEGDKVMYQTKGDANNVEDKGLRTQDQIKGKVIIRFVNAGHIVLFLQRNAIIIAVLIVGIIIIIALIKKLIS